MRVGSEDGEGDGEDWDWACVTWVGGNDEGRAVDWQALRIRLATRTNRLSQEIF